MGYLYTTYSSTKEVMKRYVIATEGAVIYSLHKIVYIIWNMGEVKYR